MSISLKPIGDRVVVKRCAAPETTEAGIILPGAPAEKRNEGVVIAIGTDKKISVQVGDHVFFHQHSGADVEVDDEKFLIIRDEDLLVVQEQ